MKVILKVFVMCVIITSLFLAGRAVSNAQDVERYVVVQESDGYSLYLNGNESDEAVGHSESLMDIVDSLSKLSGETELNF